jgi:serine/threonine protein kinase
MSYRTSSPAPERLLDVASMDHRADLRSLGVMLIELLIGARPFHRTSAGGMMEAVRSDPALELAGEGRLDP